ncbi:MAG: spore germination protein, partial [Clostridia bacterium]|nr:spore germination protein [Clostridia bacterium]
LINGSPYAIILPAILIDFLASPEDSNLNYHYANFLRLIRCFAMFFALLLPGLYVAITTYHQELIPSELLFAIVNAREAIPFPILFEILIMESSFELIQEASIRVSSSFSTTIGIIGALILGDAAVSANIVSPILIIIVAFTGICGFSIPNFSLKFSVRIFRFMYIILGYIAGFLGITFGAFVHFAFLCSQTSFGVPFISPYIPFTDTKSIDNLYMPPVWKRENRSSFLNTKQPDSEKHISMKWRKNEQQ